jgi:AraC-like DNA-binding protein/mannose-6-phosphate isomerase-like protein (cupin superfamily)
MNMRPTFKSQGLRYEIDSCVQQNQAIASGKVEWHGLTKGHYPGALIPRNILPRLSAIGYWDASGDPDWGEEPHRNEGVEVLFLETGTMAFTVDGKRYDLRAGQFTITRPWQLHNLGGPHVGPGLVYWLILDVGVRRRNQSWHWPSWLVLTKDDLSDFTTKLRHNENPVWNSTAEITESYRQIGKTIDTWKKPRSVSHLAAHLNRLFILILEALYTQQKEDSPQLTSTRRTVELFLNELRTSIAVSSDKWSKTSMAERCGIGTTTLLKYCRELVNSGPTEYLNYCRLNHAADLLKNKPELSITDIALQCGFNSSQYFATRFRQQFCTTPQLFRLRKI